MNENISLDEEEKHKDNIIVQNLQAQLTHFNPSYLEIESQNLTNINLLSQLAQFSEGVTFINISHNSIMDLFPLETFQNITTLQLKGNQLTSLKTLPRLYFLEELQLQHNNLRSLEGIQRVNQSLRHLNISHNFIRSLEFLQSAHNLKTLIAINNHLTPLGLLYVSKLPLEEAMFYVHDVSEENKVKGKDQNNNFTNYENYLLQRYFIISCLPRTLKWLDYTINVKEHYHVAGDTYFIIEHDTKTLTPIQLNLQDCSYLNIIAGMVNQIFDQSKQINIFLQNNRIKTFNLNHITK